MTDLEKDVREMRDALKRIEKALGIGSLTPASVVNINRKAMRDAETIRGKKNVSKTERQ